MTHREARCLFTRLKAQLVLWIFDQGWECAEAEGYVKDTDSADGDYDGPHKKGGAHYLGTGADLNVYVNGKWISDGDHPVWQIIGRKWLSMDSLARWGGNFPSRDSNHISVLFQGKQ